MTMNVDHIHKCSFWHRNRAREERWVGVEVPAHELVRIRNQQVAEDVQDPPCGKCDMCLISLDDSISTPNPLPPTDITLEDDDSRGWTEETIDE